MPTVTASAPGKLILLGEHAAVYGCPAVVAAVGRRVRATFRPRAGGALRLELPALDVTLESTVEAQRRFAAEARSRWRAVAAERGPHAAATAGDDPTQLVRIACGEVAEQLGDRLPGGTLTVESELPLGAGLGSSAATASAVVAALLRAATGACSEADVERLVFEVERRQHGAPSGIDHNTVLRGGLVLAAQDAVGERVYVELPRRDGVLRQLRVVDTGRPSESTGEVVAAVAARRRQHREEVDRVLAEMRRIVERWVERYRSGGEIEAIDPVRGYQACLERLGVVPAAVADLVRSVEAVGGAAKISGAGALTGRAAGCLLVSASGESAGALEEILAAFPRLDVELGSPGLEVAA